VSSCYKSFLEVWRYKLCLLWTFWNLYCFVTFAVMLLVARVWHCPLWLCSVHAATLCCVCFNAVLPLVDLMLSWVLYIYTFGDLWIFIARVIYQIKFAVICKFSLGWTRFILSAYIFFNAAMFDLLINWINCYINYHACIIVYKLFIFIFQSHDWALLVWETQVTMTNNTNTAILINQHPILLGNYAHFGVFVKVYLYLINTNLFIIYF